MERKTLYTMIPYLIFLGTVFLFFTPVFRSGVTPYSGDFTGSDLTELNIPLRYIAQKSLHEGKVPLWTQELSGGFPILAEGQAGVFYPFNLIFLYFFPLSLAINIILIIHFFLATVFLFIFLREIKISAWGSTLASIAFAFSGFFIFRIKHVNFINAGIWLGLELYLIEKYFSAKKKKIFFLLLSCVFAIQFFAGHTQIFYISFLGCFVYFSMRYFSSALYQKKVVPAILKIFLFWFLLSVTVIGATAIQLLPSFELSQMASRSEWINYSTATRFRYDPANVLTFISPYIFGNPALGTYEKDIVDFGVFWESNAYIGIAPFLLALFAIFFAFKKNNHVKIFLVLLFFSFVFILGSYTPLYKIFWHIVPGMKMFRFPQRFILLALVSFLALCGFGFDIARTKLLSYVNKKNKKYVQSVAYGFAAVMIGLTIFNLYGVHRQYNNYVSLEKYIVPPKTAEFFGQDKDIFRIMSVHWADEWRGVNEMSGGWQKNLDSYFKFREAIAPNLNLFWGISSIDDRGIFEGGIGGIQYFSRLQKPLWDNIVPLDESGRSLVNENSLKLEGMQNVKYVLSFFDVVSANNSLKKVKEVNISPLPSMKIYENSYFLPRAMAFFHVIKKKDSEEAYKFITQPEFNPRETLFVEEVGKTGELKNAGKGTVAITKIEDTSIRMNVDFSDDGYVFVSNVFYPGWKARIDDTIAPIVKANYAFQAIFVPKGRHNIAFSYEPLYYKVGKYISIISIFAIFALMAFFISRKNSEKKILDRNTLDDHHNAIPFDFYHKGIEKNILQKVWHEKRFALILDAFSSVGIGPKDAVLELGCNTGYILEKIAQKTHAKVIGMDISKSAISYARKRYPDIQFFEGDISNPLPFPENSFTVVAAFDVLEHIIDLERVIESVRRVLVRGGYFFVAFPRETLLFKIVWFIWTHFKGRVLQGVHVRDLSRGTDPLFSKNGFREIDNKKSHGNMWNLVVFKLEK